MLDDKIVNKQIKSTGTWEDVLRAVEENMLVVTTKGIAKGIPGVGSVVSASDDVTKQLLRKHLDDSRRELVSCLKEASPAFTLSSVSKEDFIIDFANLYQACMRLRSNEKIQFMVKLFVSAHCGDTLCDLDEYDEMSERLDRLSLREIKLLCMLHKHAESNAEFYEAAQNELGLEKELINNMLSSMTQSGFCKEKVGTYLSYNGNSYYTTELYGRFLKLLNIDDGVDAEEIEKRRSKREEGILEIVSQEEIEALAARK